MNNLQTMQGQIRFLKYYAAATTVLIAVLLLAGFKQSGESMQLKELTVEKINVVDKDGKVRVLLAGSFPPRRSELAGLLFVNQEGTEAGGLVYAGQKKGEHVSAAAALTMDQYNDDQIVALQYDEENGKRRHGLTIADRPDMLGPEALAVYGILDTMAEGPARDSLSRVLFAKVPPDQLAARRIFVGRDPNKAALVDLSDRRGKPRLRLMVDSLGNARISFLDANGNVVQTIP
ncbi:MAG: hypothetical protein HYR76_13070 [Ignavibacteria bacterium]|nr:hypothetical protein [Ignavibacteria bacterium]